MSYTANLRNLAVVTTATAVSLATPISPLPASAKPLSCNPLDLAPLPSMVLAVNANMQTGLGSDDAVIGKFAPNGIVEFDRLTYSTKIGYSQPQIPTVLTLPEVNNFVASTKIFNSTPLCKAVTPTPVNH